MVWPLGGDDGLDFERWLLLVLLAALLVLLLPAFLPSSEVIRPGP